MTERLIDLLCRRHVGQILDTTLWPREWRSSAVCSDCEGGFLPMLPQVDMDWQVAVHECGHAIVHLVTGSTVTLVTLDPADLPVNAAAGVRFSNPGGSYDAAALMAGRAASSFWLRLEEELSEADLVDLAFGAQHDFVAAYDGGLTDDHVLLALDRAHDMVEDSWADIERLTGLLVARRRLTGWDLSEAGVTS